MAHIFVIGWIHLPGPYDVSDVSCHISYVFIVVKLLRHLGPEKTPRHL